MSRRDVFSSRMFARDRRMWIVTLAAALALWAGTSTWLNRRVALAERRPAGPGDDGRFVVLAYDRIVRVPDGRSLDRVRLREELRALASAGWQAVTLEDLLGAYSGKVRLPARPILITFDEGYLDTYEAADPVLRELRWPAVMMLRTELQETRDVSFLFWDRLQRMLQSGVWEVASGDPAAVPASRAAGEIPSEPPGAAMIARRLGSQAGMAWAPRGTEPLIALACAPAGERAWREGRQVPWLGFVDDAVGANLPTANPFRIGRLRVDPRWSGSELLSRVDAAVADPAARSAHEPALAPAWIPGEGARPTGENAVRLEGHPRAEIWIPSTRWLDDWSLDVRLRIASGEFWIVQPEGSPGREWRVGGTARSVYVEDRGPDRPPDVLAAADAATSSSHEHRVRIVKRGGGVSVFWDGRPLTPNPVALPGRWRGKVGVIAYASGGLASLTVESLELSPFPFGVRAVPASPRADEIAAMARDAETIAALSPVWATIDGESVHEEPFDRDLFRILSRRYAWDIVPAVVLKGGWPAGKAATAWIAGIPERVDREGWAGIRLDLSLASRKASQEWSGAAHDLDAGLRRAHKRLVVVAP